MSKYKAGDILQRNNYEDVLLVVAVKGRFYKVVYLLLFDSNEIKSRLSQPVDNIHYLVTDTFRGSFSEKKV